MELGIHEVEGVFLSLKGTALGLPAGEARCPLSPGLLFAQQLETNDILVTWVDVKHAHSVFSLGTVLPTRS